ncbi:MAG: ribose-5-phosphate isomerase A [Thermoguttaceae bacterium]|nr:ribose-5-phosphate isomerase A [Thermoguttaceae bacterium]
MIREAPSPQPRYERETPFITDNGNYIIDCRTGPLESPAALERMLNDTPGVVGTGLFLQMAEAVLVARGGEVETLARGSSA